MAETVMEGEEPSAMQSNAWVMESFDHSLMSLEQVPDL
jgi:hypothetical protein